MLDLSVDGAGTACDASDCNGTEKQQGSATVNAVVWEQGNFRSLFPRQTHF